MRRRPNAMVRAWESLVHALSWPERAWSRWRNRRAKSDARKLMAPEPPRPRTKKSLREWLRKFFGLRDPGFIPPAVPQAMVKRSLGNRIRRMFGSADLVVSYERSRRTLGMWLGAIPAVLALVCLAVASFGFDVSQTSMLGKYRKIADKARDDGNDALAELSLRRLAKGSITEEEKLRLVKLEIKRQQSDRAMALLDDMASPNRQGYPMAHRMKAQFLLEQAPLNAEQVQEYEAHLKFCLNDDALKHEAHALLGNLYWNDLRRPALAEEHYRRAAVRMPGMNRSLSHVLRAQGKSEQAAGAIRDYLAFAEPRLETDPANEQLRLAVVASHMEAEEFEKAIGVLNRAAPLKPSAALVQMRAVVLGSYARHELAQMHDANAYRLVEIGLAEFPNFGLFYEVLVKLSVGDSGKAAEASARVEKLLAAGGPLADPLHLLVGTYAGSKKDYEKARRHFDIVFKNNPNAADVANNLAVTLANTDPPQLDRALDLVNQAITTTSKEPQSAQANLKLLQMRETRGQIYVKKKMWNEALDDLAFVVRGMPNHAGTHRGLAETYEALGEKSLAEQHRQNAQRLTPPPPKQPAGRDSAPKK